jgi:hypothetical protein
MALRSQWSWLRAQCAGSTCRRAVREMTRPEAAGGLGCAVWNERSERVKCPRVSEADVTEASSWPQWGGAGGRRGRWTASLQGHTASLSQ